MTGPLTPQIPPGLPLIRARLIFNPAAGNVDESPFRLAELLTQLQAWNILPEVHMVTPASDVAGVAAHAIAHGAEMVIVAGGDGTIENAAGPLVGTGTTLGIIPAGTRNNLAHSLAIPPTLPEAVALLRQGNRIRMDVGRAECNTGGRWFLETSSIGLVSALYPAADEIQHGNLARIADLLSTFVTAQPAEMRLTVDGGDAIAAQGHLTFVANAPYYGANFQLSPDVSFLDGVLDLFIFSELTKLELVSYAVQITAGAVEDPRILHYRVHRVAVESSPPMPVMADGVGLGEGRLVAEIHPAALAVMSGLPPAPPEAMEANRP